MDESSSLLCTFFLIVIVMMSHLATHLLTPGAERCWWKVPYVLLAQFVVAECLVCVNKHTVSCNVRHLSHEAESVVVDMLGKKPKTSAAMVRRTMGRSCETACSLCGCGRV